jgi:uncharacterized phage infection (PIP) family protein YhgE
LPPEGESVVPDDDIEKLLADFDSEDQTEGEESDVNKNRPNAVKQLRDYADRLKKDLAKEKKNAAALQAFKESYEAKEKVNTLTTAGLSEKQSAAFLRMYDDVTPENVSSFKADILGLKAEGEEQSSAPARFAPTQGYSEPGNKPYTKEEFEAVMRENPAEGWRILNSGQVKF